MKKGQKHITKLEKELQLQMLKMVAEGVDVAEIYSPPRVVKRAQEIGLKPGWGLDLTTKDTDGRPWDFSKKEAKERAIMKIRKDKPRAST